MKLSVMSDLHLEFEEQPQLSDSLRGIPVSEFYRQPPSTDADVLILAGDIHLGAGGVAWAHSRFRMPAVVIAGNHESYGGEWHDTVRRGRERAAATAGHVAFLERQVWVRRFAAGAPLRVLGTTLWTDFELDGDAARAMQVAGRRMIDYSLIDLEADGVRRPLQPPDTVDFHRASVAFLRAELARPFAGHTVVVTHHAPSAGSIASKFDGNPLNPGFASRLEPLIRQFQPALWVHGHMHDSFDYTIGRTRVLCNPRGYVPDQLNPSFDPTLVVELAE